MGPPKVEVHSLRKVGERGVMKKDKSDTTGWDSSKKMMQFTQKTAVPIFSVTLLLKKKMKKKKWQSVTWQESGVPKNAILQVTYFWRTPR